MIMLKKPCGLFGPKHGACITHNTALVLQGPVPSVFLKEGNMVKNIVFLKEGRHGQKQC
jgi:hypothetical protein